LKRRFCIAASLSNFVTVVPAADVKRCNFFYIGLAFVAFLSVGYDEKVVTLQTYMRCRQRTVGVGV
jgi:hypothetical protein